MRTQQSNWKRLRNEADGLRERDGRHPPTLNLAALAQTGVIGVRIERPQRGAARDLVNDEGCFLAVRRDGKGKRHGSGVIIAQADAAVPAAAAIPGKERAVLVEKRLQAHQEGAIAERLRVELLHE